jgi:hypothetical protein
VPTYRGFSAVCRPIPYVREQGIYCPEQGILFDRTGNELENAGNSRELACHGFAFTKAAGLPGRDRRTKRQFPMTTPNESSLTNRSADLQAALRFCSGALRIAAAGYDPSRPADGRACVRIALVGVIHLISELCPNEASVLLPLNELLYGLHDLDHGKVVPLLGRPRYLTLRVMRCRMSCSGRWPLRR